MFDHNMGHHFAHQDALHHQDMMQQDALHQQQAVQTAQDAHQQLEAMHQEAVQLHFSFAHPFSSAWQSFCALLDVIFG